MSKVLELKIKLDAINKASAPIKALIGDTAALGKQLKNTKSVLSGFEEQQRRLSKFSSTVENARAASAAYKKQQAAVAALNVKLEGHRFVQNKVAGEVTTARRSYQALFAEVNKTPSPPTHMLKNLTLQKVALDEVESRYNKLKNSGKRLREEIKDGSRNLESAKKTKDKYGETLKRLSGELKEAGLSTKKLDSQQEAIQASINTATAAMERQKEVLRKLHTAAEAYGNAINLRNKIAGAGMSMVATGAAMGAPVVKAVRDYTAFEDAMLGVARQVEGTRDASGKLTPVYYEMGEAIKSMAERIPMATTEIAALIEAGARMGIQGKENLLAFAETTATTATAFDLPVEDVGDNMAKLAQLYGVPIAKISELGDAINWLDDNALSKGGDIINVMQRIAGTATGLGVAYQEAAALGSTFLSLGAGAEVAASASNAMMRELSVANMQSKRFKSGLEMLKLNGAEIQLSMSKDATGTIIRVMEAIKALPQEQQIEAATRLFGKEYGDDAAKLANHLAVYREQLEMVRGEEQKGSMQREAAARMQTLSAQYELAKNSVFNLSSQIGESLKPALLSLMQAAASVLNGIRDWVKEHPTLTGVLVKGLAVTAAIVTALGGLALAVAAVIGPLAVMRYGFAMLSIMGGSTLPMLMTLGKTILPLVGNAILFIGRALMLNPIGLIITAIAGAAFLIYRYWGPISTFFSGLWTNITTFARTAWAGLIEFFLGLPAQMLTIGGQIIDGLWQGLTGKWAVLKTKVAEIAGSVAGTVKDVLGIHSPSRVFAELGGYTMQGLQMGILAASAGPLGAITKTAAGLATAGAVSLGAAMPALAVDNRPPLTAGRAAGGGMAGDGIQIIVQPSPGMDEAKLADLVARKLAEVQRLKAAAARSRLTDQE